MKKGKIHLAGPDPFAQGSNYVLLGCCNPQSEYAVSVIKTNTRITTNPAEVTCCHCRAKMAREHKP